LLSRSKPRWRSSMKSRSPWSTNRSLLRLNWWPSPMKTTRNPAIINRTLGQALAQQPNEKTKCRLMLIASTKTNEQACCVHILRKPQT
jgi:hypothetical protein